MAVAKTRVIHGLVTYYRVAFIAQLEVIAVVYPLLLHKLKLPFNVGVQGHENNAMFVSVGGVGGAGTIG